MSNNVRSIASLAALTVGIVASFASDCGALPMPLHSTDGPNLEVNEATVSHEYRADMQADPSVFPYGAERYSQVLVDFQTVDRTTSTEVRVTVSDDIRMQQVQEDVLLTPDHASGQLAIEGVFDNCPEDGICNRSLSITFEYLSGDATLEWAVSAELEAD